MFNSSRLNPADAGFLTRLASRLPPDTLRAPEPRDLEEPRGRWQGRAGAVARPRSTEEVAEIVRAAAEALVPIVPLGGGTGLVGGQVMAEGLPLLLSLDRMTAIRGVWPEENVLEVEAGATIEAIHHAAEAAGRLFPLTLASQGTAQIGGCLSTNAGGVNVLRYGTARELCLGIEAVLPDGSVMHGLKRLRKDNTGYDLRGLLIGAEGTLGIITGAMLKLFPRPAATGAAMVVVPGPTEALSLLALARDRIGEGVSAFELIGRNSYAFMAETMPDVRLPLPLPGWSVLIDLGLSSGEPAEVLEALLADAMERGLVTDGVIAASEAQRQAFWAFRESIPEANRRIGAISSHDISVPLSRLADFIAEAEAALTPAGVRINCFGHVGDGNLHFNLFPAEGRGRAEYAAQAADLARLVYDKVAERGGAFSAEHGVGRARTGDVAHYGDPARIAAMAAIKRALDPPGILNPGVMIPAAAMGHAALGQSE